MAVEVILPRVDMDMTAGRISKWHAKDGDWVVKGAPLFEIETDKAAMEIESPADGILGSIAVGEGQSSPVGAAIAFIYAEGEVHAAIAPPPATTPAAANVAPATTARGPEMLATDGSLRATPLARRLARESGIALSAIAGSGPRGRIVAADVKRAAVAAPASAISSAAEQIASHYRPGSFERLPLDNMRRTIAARLTQSKQTVPHFYLTATCTLDKLLKVRTALNASAPLGGGGQPAWKLSINDFVIKALGLALQRVPAANVTWAEDSILRHSASDIGVAVAVEGGLFTPVLRDVERKPLAALSADMKDLAAKVRARKLAPADYHGGSSAVSNLGMYGIEEFTAIVNPPQATILAVGAAVERFIPVKGQPLLATQMTCTLSCDHRAVDGAIGAELLRQFRTLIEEPMLMLA